MRHTPTQTPKKSNERGVIRLIRLEPSQLREAREAAGFTRAGFHLALHDAGIDVSYGTIRTWEDGRNEPTRDIWVKIEKWLEHKLPSSWMLANCECAGVSETVETA